MIAFLTNIAPIGLGFIAKLYALKSQAASDQQKLMIENLQARNDSINQARQMAEKESPMAAMNRRVIITVKEGWSILGMFQITPDVVEYVKLEAGSVVKMDELFKWASMIIEFYFGGQLAKGK